MELKSWVFSVVEEDDDEEVNELSPSMDPDLDLGGVDRARSNGGWAMRGGVSGSFRETDKGRAGNDGTGDIALGLASIALAMGSEDWREDMLANVAEESSCETLRVDDALLLGIAKSLWEPDPSSPSCEVL